MRNRQHSRLLTTLVLVAAMSVALGSEALAASRNTSMNSLQSSWHGGKALKPGVTTAAGEPDSPTGAPLPPKVGPNAARGTTAADWTLRFQYVLRTLLLQSPKRFP